MISIFKYIFLFLFSFFSFRFNVDLTKPNELMNVIYHETTNFEEHNRKEQNAVNRGNTGAGIFSLKNFGNENTNGMSKTEWIVANADKDTISTGTLGLVSDLYNTATKKGEGEPFIISSALTGLVVAGSIYSIQDSARKIYAWIDGEGYKGNTTYIDPIDGRTYTAEGNIKEGALELATAATAAIAVKGIGKVVGKAGKSVKDTVNSIDKSASSPIGYSGAEMKVVRGTNSPKIISNRYYTGHALDQMQGRGITPTVVENTISVGKKITNANKVLYYDSVNNISVITNSNGSIITAYRGKAKLK